MTDIVGNPALMLLLGVVASFVTSLFTQYHWPNSVKQVVAIAVAAFFGAIGLWLRIAAGSVDYSPDVLIGHLTAVFVTATFVYWFILKGTGTPVAAFNAWLQQLGPGGAAPATLNDEGPVELEPIFGRQAIMTMPPPNPVSTDPSPPGIVLP